MKWEDKTPEEWEKLSKTIRYSLVMKHLKLGDVINQEILDANEFFYGAIFKAMPEPETIATIHFDKLGQPHTLNDDVISIKENEE